MDKALYMEDVCLRYKNRNILTDVTFEVDHTEIVAVCGAEGSGKDYIERMLLRNYDGKYSLTGKLIVNGVEIEKLSQDDMRFVRMMDIGVLPIVSKKAVKGLSVSEYITKPFSEDVKKSKKEIILDAKRVMELLGVKNPEKIMNKKMAALKRKDLRAVMYSSAISTDPSVLISYGPDKDMTEAETEEMYKLLIKICKIKNTAMLILTSDIGFARKTGEKVYFVKNDRLIEDNSIEHSYINLLERAQLGMKLEQTVKSEEELISFDSLSLAKGREVLNFSICSGEVKCFLGDSKTVKVFLGDRKPYKGSILRDGKNIRNIKPFDRGIFPITYSLVTPDVESVYEWIASCAEAGGAEHRTRCGMEVQMALSAAGLPADFGVMPLKDITIFEKYKVAIACAIARKADILLISDIEDIKGYAERYELLNLIKAVCESENKATIIITRSAKIKELLN